MNQISTPKYTYKKHISTEGYLLVQKRNTMWDTDMVETYKEVYEIYGGGACGTDLCEPATHSEVSCICQAISDPFGQRSCNRVCCMCTNSLHTEFKCVTKNVFDLQLSRVYNLLALVTWFPNADKQYCSSLQWVVD